MRRKRKGSLKRTLLSIIFIVVGIFVCSISMVVGIDSYCASDIDKWLPIYPDAELVDADEEGFFRPRAMGITEQIYYTEDEAADVRRWYTDYRRELTQGSYNANNSNSAVAGIATTNYRISEDRENGGTVIVTFSECAYN